MLLSEERPPLIALFVSHDAVHDSVTGLAACDPNLVIQSTTVAACRRDLTRLKADVIIVDGGVAGAVELIHAISGGRPSLATLFLGACADDVRAAMCAGAHDFVLASTSAAECALRIRLLSSAMVRSMQKEHRIGSLRIDRERRTLSVGADSVSLSPIEFKMFEQLLLHGGRPVSRAELEEAIWGQAELAEHPTNIAVVYVSYLRRKLGRLGGACSITTIPNTGYALHLDARPERLPRPTRGRAPR